MVAKTTKKQQNTTLNKLWRGGAYYVQAQINSGVTVTVFAPEEFITITI